MEILFVFIGGLLLGFGLAWGISYLRKRDSEIMFSRVKDSFATLSLKALDEFHHLARESLGKQHQLSGAELENKKQLIDHALIGVKEDIHKVQQIITGLEKDRDQKFGEISNLMKVVQEQNEKLHIST